MYWLTNILPCLNEDYVAHAEFVCLSRNRGLDFRDIICAPRYSKEEEFVSGWQADQLMDAIKVWLTVQLSSFVLLSENIFLFIAIISLKTRRAVLKRHSNNEGNLQQQQQPLFYPQILQIQIEL